MKQTFKKQNPGGGRWMVRGARALAMAALVGAFSTLSNLAHAGVVPTPIATIADFAAPADFVGPIFTGWHTTITANPAGGAIFHFQGSAAGSSSGAQVLNYNNVDFSAGGATAFDLTNPQSSPVNACFLLVDTSGRLCGLNFTVPASSTTSYCLLNHAIPQTNSYGLEFLPTPYKGYTILQPGGGADKTFDFAHVASFQMYVYGPSSDTSLILENMKLLSPFSYDSLLGGFIDQYGQGTIYPYANYLTSPSEFQTRYSAELASLQGGPLLTNVDQYGGTMSMSTQQSNGHFRVAKINSQWWLVDPAGHLFFAAGMDGVTPTNTLTPVTGANSALFTSLPSNGDPLAQFYVSYNGNSQGAYNFYGANLYRKYGSNWMSTWQSMTYNRLRNWGFNTIGNWSDPWTYSAKMPYVARVAGTGNFAHVSAGNDLWGPLPDPFDPAWVSAMDNNVHQLAIVSGNDPYCIGFVHDNELSWTGGTGHQYDGLGYGTMALSASSSPAKAAFVKTLEARYLRVTKLNAVWGTRFTSWAQVQGPVTNLPANPTSWMERDFRGWEFTYANAYYSKMKALVKKYAPNTLYIGSQLDHWTPEVIQACATNVDVMTINKYAYSMPTDEAAALAQFDTPYMISEFSFGSAESGLFGALVFTPDDASRASSLTNFVGSMLDSTHCVGCNWYLYQDQPASGEIQTGANCNEGFVDVTDTPYNYLVQAAKQVNSTIYTRHANAVNP